VSVVVRSSLEGTKYTVWGQLGFAETGERGLGLKDFLSRSSPLEGDHKGDRGEGLFEGGLRGGGDGEGKS